MNYLFSYSNIFIRSNILFTLIDYWEAYEEAFAFDDEEEQEDVVEIGIESGEEKKPKDGH